MSKLNSINGGYNGGSPKVRSENFKKPFIDPNFKKINAQELSDQIIRWYGDGRISLDGIQTIINQLQKL